MHPLLETRPTTQACALTGNRTSYPLVLRPTLNPLSHTSQGRNLFGKSDGHSAELTWLANSREGTWRRRIPHSLRWSFTIDTFAQGTCPCESVSQLAFRLSENVVRAKPWGTEAILVFSYISLNTTLLRGNKNPVLMTLHADTCLKRPMKGKHVAGAWAELTDSNWAEKSENQTGAKRQFYLLQQDYLTRGTFQLLGVILSAQEAHRMFLKFG